MFEDFIFHMLRLFSQKNNKTVFLRTEIFYKSTVVKVLKETEVYDIVTQVYI